MARVLVSPLAWGLGHATRDIPIIRELLRHGHKVTIASSGRALHLLQQEFPDCQFLLFPDYPAPYTKTPYYIAKFIAYIPVMLKAIKEEKKTADRIFSQERYHLVISDNRFGVYAEDIPSFFISHQLRFSVPPYIFAGEYFSGLFNSYYHEKFLRVIVPDNDPETVSLSGKLSRSKRYATQKRVYYAGILSSVKKMDVPEDIDFLISISGPEPQRTTFEEILLPQVPRLPGTKVVLLGRPAEEVQLELDSHTRVRPHADREEMAQLMSRARFIISRSGYTTVMEIAELEKKQCLFVPTPGQTEQEYLSEYYQKQGWFYSRSQYHLNLPADVDEARKYSGFPPMPKSEANARKMYQELFAPHLN